MKFENEEQQNKFFDLASKISNSYLDILALTPKDNKYLKYLAKSSFLFCSFVLFTHDEIKENK